ncbi:hypothetical protein RND71_004287 [Anisodus tanguticus]|uniref:Response regulatory domain-containing protein n=1 Tax=Anisodus tanguticus TaxID=243964 RepID=A0AAE1T0B9_9SOLA|nr:hypothetical protein RND71_004287 [Anisodus tanguticus]
MGMAATESQFHVLAVDDSVIDRKLIERLLKTSACQVTTVDSGSKALEFLGLQEHDKNHTNQPCVSLDNHQFDMFSEQESASLRNIPVVIMSSENVPSRINRCLEEGAEEFFLKPVRLSDVNKLRPHMMKTKCKSHKQEESEIIVTEEKQASIEIAHVVPSEPPKETDTVQQQQQQKSQVNSNNKRKAMEENLSPDRTRPRYSSLTTAL